MSVAAHRALPGGLVFMCLLTSGQAFGQEAVLAPLAERVAMDLAKARLKSVVVFVFSGPGQEKTELGQQLADDFSSALRSSSNPPTVIERARLDPLIEKYRLDPERISQWDVSNWLCRQVGAKALIAGYFKIGENSVFLTVGGYDTSEEREAFETSQEHEITRQTHQLPLTDQMRTLAAAPLPASSRPTPGPADAFRAGTGGIGYPHCVSCPVPEYTELARRAWLECTVVMRAIITREGRAQNIGVTQSCPMGLTGKAIKAVQSWKFKPATGPDGSPVNAWTPIEISFRMK